MKIFGFYYNRKLYTIQNELNKLKGNANMEAFARKVSLNPIQKKRTILFLAMLMFVSQNVYAIPTVAGFEGLNSIGNYLISIVRYFGFWFIVIKCMLDVLSCMIQKKTKDITNIIMQYVLGYMALYGITIALDFISVIMSNVEIALPKSVMN